MFHVDSSKIKRFCRLGLACLALMPLLGLHAAEGWPIETTSEAVKGVWMDNFAKATNLAFTTKTPMVMFWANRRCEYCEKLEDAINSAEFKAWQAAHPDYVYNFVFASDGNDLEPNADSGARDFVRSAGGTMSPLSYYPFVCLYWPKADGTTFVASYVGRAGYLDKDAYNAGKSLEEEFEACIEAHFSEYRPEQSIPEYTGGVLAFTAEYDNARLEAEAGITTHVDIPLRREAVAVGYVGTNTLKAVHGGATILERTFVWDAQQAAATVTLPIPADAAAGEKIAVTLYDVSGSPRGTVNVHVVAERENAPKNPYFVGEKTADELGYGEWTMDLDVATAKYKANADSKLLVLVGGPLWCPDCVMADAHLLDRAEFREWAVEHKVILVDIDIPNLPNTTNSPSLLTRIVSRASDGYITGRGTLEADETQRYQSGAGYLSRHMVSEEEAEKVIERNRKLVGTNTLGGGWNSPDRANQNRTGVPIFLTLRRDGTLSGRLETFSAVAPREFKTAHLRRLEELLATASDVSGASEEANASWQTTEESFSGAGTFTGATLSAIDLTDTYELGTVTDEAAEQTITVGGVDTNANVTVSLLQVIDGTVTTLATAKGTLSDGVTVRGIIGTGAQYYVQVSGEAKGTFAIDSPSSSTVTAYTLLGTRVAIENPYSNDWTAKAVTSTLPLYGADGSDTVLLGTLAIKLKKNKSVSAEYSNGKQTLASFSGKWKDGDMAVDGTVRLTLERSGYALALTLKADGTIEASISDGSVVLSSGECILAETYADFRGYYTVLLPTLNAGASSMSPAGESFMTLNLPTATAGKKGKFNYKIYFADGKNLTGSTYVTWLDADFGLVPILRSSGGYTAAVVVKVRKSAATAPSSRAVVAMDGVTSRLACTKIGQAFGMDVGVYGSYYDKNRSLVEQSGVENLAWTADVSNFADSPTYGALGSVAGNGSGLTVTPRKIFATERTDGFTFSFKVATGLFSGKSNLAFAGKPNLSAKYSGIVLPGWFTDCDCGEDDDKLIPLVSLPFGCGYCVFSDKADGKKIKRSFPVGMDVSAE